MKVKFEELKKMNLDELLALLPIEIAEHSRRVAVCSALMTSVATSIADMPALGNAENLAVVAHFGGLCHDIGKILGGCFEYEETYSSHPYRGVEILLQNSEELFDAINQRQMVLEMTRFHHERPDGTGFPNGYTQREIPFCAAICAVADRLDNLVYAQNKQQLTPVEVLPYFTNEIAKSFTDTAVGCLESAIGPISDFYAQWNLEH